MKGYPSKVALVLGLLLAGLGCGRPTPITPSRPVPPGAVLFQFTRKVTGDLDLTIDGVRVPVDHPKKSKWRRLEVTGLEPGVHRFILLGTLEAFGPDQIEVEVGTGAGAFRVLFAQQLKSVLYGQPDPPPAAPGIPGVKARLEP